MLKNTLLLSLGVLISISSYGCGVKWAKPPEKVNSNLSWSYDSNKLVFTSVKDSNYEIYSIKSDSTELTRLTNSPDPDVSPIWKKDSNNIYFLSKSNEAKKLYIKEINSNGTNLNIKRTFNLNELFDSNYSNNFNGTGLRFINDHKIILDEFIKNGESKVFILDIDNNSKLDSNIKTYSEISLSSASGKVLNHILNSEEKFTSELNLIDSTTNSVKKIPVSIKTNTRYNVTFLSPDGQKIAYLEPSVNSDMYILNIVDTDGNNRRMIKEISYSKISWSPDNNKILIHDRKNNKLQIINTSDLSEKMIDLVSAECTYCAYDQMETVWSPDGTKIAFLVDQGNISVINTDGTNEKKITNFELPSLTF